MSTRASPDSFPIVPSGISPGFVQGYIPNSNKDCCRDFFNDSSRNSYTDGGFPKLHQKSLKDSFSFFSRDIFRDFSRAALKNSVQDSFIDCCRGLLIDFAPMF